MRRLDAYFPLLLLIFFIALGLQFAVAFGADPPVPTQQEIDYRKCLSAVGPRQTWAKGSENCPDVIKTWRANNPKTMW